MGLDSIIALDLGKFKSVACVRDAGSRRHRFDTLDTTPQTMHEKHNSSSEENKEPGESGGSGEVPRTSDLD